MPTLIAEDVLLLMLDDDTGAFVAADNLKPALAGSVLAELALLGAVEIESGKGWWTRTRVLLDDDATAVSDPLLLGALADIGEKSRSPEGLVNRLGRNLPEQLCTRLAERGILRREESRILGVFPRTRWPAADSAHEIDLRRALQRALVGGEEPDERIATVIAVLLAADVLIKVVDRGPLSKRDLRTRAEQIADAGWATEAVRQAIRAARTAVAAAVAAATAVAVTSGS